MVGDAGHGPARGITTRLPLLVGLRVRGRRPWGPSDRRGQLPERIRARGTVHHGPERDGGDLPPGDPAPGRRHETASPELQPRGRRDPLGGRPPRRRVPERDPPSGRLHLPRPLRSGPLRGLGPGHAAPERGVRVPHAPPHAAARPGGRRVVVPHDPRRDGLGHRVFRRRLAPVPDQRPEHGDLLRTREALGPPDPPAPGRPDPPDRVLPDLRDDEPRIERPDPVRRRRGHDPEPDDPVQARLLQLDVLPVVHRIFTGGPGFQRHGHPGVRPGAPSVPAGARLEPHPLPRRVSELLLQSVPGSREPHGRLEGDELR